VLNGSFPVRKGHLLASTLRVTGANAAHGTVRVGASTKHVTGSLGGHRFNLSTARVKLSRAVAGEWPTTAPTPRPREREAQPRRG
jgi:hypothetical protein